MPSLSLHLGNYPTPVEHIRSLSTPRSELWVKRDDRTNAQYGGNKVRKLEYLMGDAKAGNHDIIITSGAIQSNHARLTAAAAAKLGHGCVLVLTDGVPGMGSPLVPILGLTALDSVLVPCHSDRNCQRPATRAISVPV